MAASITVHLQIFKRLQLLSFSTDLDETGIKIHGLKRLQQMTMLRYLAEPKSNFWSESSSTSILCMCEQQRFWESVHLHKLSEPSLLDNISTKMFLGKIVKIIIFRENYLYGFT